MELEGGTATGVFPRIRFNNMPNNLSRWYGIVLKCDGILSLDVNAPTRALLISRVRFGRAKESLGSHVAPTPTI